MKFTVQILSLLLIGFMHLHSCTRCRQEDILVYDCTNLSLTDLPSERLGHVYKLDLSHNEITILKNDIFLDRDLVDIAILYMQDNKITTIEVNAFRGMRELDFLNLNNNDIVDIPADIFKSNKRMRFLRFENNTRLKLPQEGFNLPDLNILDLERCGLETIPANFFEHMKDLETIYLRGNKLSYIDPGLIKPLNELEFLDLRENVFTKLQLDILRLPLLFKVSYVGNPLNCDCALLRAYSLYKKRAPFEDLSCRSDNGTLKTDLTKLESQLGCNPTTTIPSTQVSEPVPGPDEPNQDNSAYITNDAESQDFYTTEQNANGMLKDDEKDHTDSESALTPIQVGIIVTSVILLTTLVIISIIIISCRPTRVNRFFISNRFRVLRESQEAEANFSFD